MSNLNAFILLIVIGYTLKHYVINKSNINTKDISYSPIQLLSQLQGYFNINPILSLSLAITLFSFAGVPPLAGFFAKQMILSTAINNGFNLTTLIAILTSVISATYYLIIIKMIFFDKSNFEIYEHILKRKNINISSYHTCIISILTLFIMLFIFIDQQVFMLINLL
jgi:NADH-ubiquinone oxidoreductase chain 2